MNLLVLPNNLSFSFEKGTSSLKKITVLVTERADIEKIVGWESFYMGRVNDNIVIDIMCNEVFPIKVTYDCNSSCFHMSRFKESELTSL